MLSKTLEDLSKDPNDPDGITELVVTALGSHGSFYICWKTRSGTYKQDCHGIPSELREWLFSPTDTPRDFASLQVILGPGEGDFVASDRHGRIDRKAAEFVPRPLERARTFQSTQSRPLSMMVSSGGSPSGIRQRRSATMGSAGASGRRASLIYEESSKVSEEAQRGTSRLSTIVPLVIRANRFRRRPISMHHTDSQPLVNLDSLPETRPDQVPRPVSSRYSHSTTKSVDILSDRLDHVISQKYVASRPISTYVDAGVQTDAPPLQPYQTNPRDYHHRRHLRDSSSASSTSSVFTSYSSEVSTRRSSVAEEHELKLNYPQTYNNLPNPVMMGRMQDYFRASNYCLGDSLQLS